jgi:hypothetical protein
MGGYNSGRQSPFVSSERTSSVVLSVNTVMRHWPPPAGPSSWVRWRVGENGDMGWFDVRFVDDGNDRGRFELTYDIRHISRLTGVQTQSIAAIARPCRFGGRRWYFLCPRSAVTCEKLFLPNGAVTFASRRAYRLAYQVEREAPIDRAHRRLARLYRKLGQDYEGPDWQWPVRKKGMRQRTFAGLEAAIGRATDRLESIFEAGCARFIAQGLDDPELLRMLGKAGR